MKKGIILFDLDKTIFNTQGMSKTFDRLMLKILNNPDLSGLEKVKKDYKNTLKRDREFIPENYVKLLANKFDPSKYQDLIDVFFASKYAYIYKENVFPETIEIIEKLKNKYVFGIYSEGAPKFQNHKYISTGLDKYVNEDLVFIVEAKDNIEVLRMLPEGAIVVDDKEIICDYLTDNKVKSIWLNCKDRKRNNKFQTIYSLLELPNVL